MTFEQANKAEQLESVTRAPCTQLSPFIEQLWASNEGFGSNDRAINSAKREIILPNGSAHIAIRLDDTPIRISQHPSDEGQLFQSAIVAGIRTKPYIKESFASASVGILLRPGTLELMSGKPASKFTNIHLNLQSIWGASIVDDLKLKMQQTSALSLRLDLIEELLKSKLPLIRGIHPAITQALARVSPAISIADLAAETGLSHRHFIKVFESSTGITPKLYSRVKRFNQVLKIRRSLPDLNWAEIATYAGFADQSHLNREFARIAGITPTKYTELSLKSDHHLVV